MLPTSERRQFIIKLHDLKREALRRMVEAGTIPVRPGEPGRRGSGCNIQGVDLAATWVSLTRQTGVTCLPTALLKSLPNAPPAQSEAFSVPAAWCLRGPHPLFDAAALHAGQAT